MVRHSFAFYLAEQGADLRTSLRLAEQQPPCSSLQGTPHAIRAFTPNQEYKWENEFMSIAAARRIPAHLQGQRTTRACHLLPLRTIGGFGCRLALSRRKAAD